MFKEKISKTLSLFSLLKKGKNNANKMKGNESKKGMTAK